MDFFDGSCIGWLATCSSDRANTGWSTTLLAEADGIRSEKVVWSMPWISDNYGWSTDWTADEDVCLMALTAEAHGRGSDKDVWSMTWSGLQLFSNLEPCGWLLLAFFIIIQCTIS